jgi:hypothetical protein
MKHVNWTFNDFVSFVAVGVEQAVDVAEHIGKKVQVKPEHTPNQNERRTDVIFRAVSAFPVPDKQSQTPEQRRDADQQPENFVGKNAVTVSRDFKNRLDGSLLLSNFYFLLFFELLRLNQKISVDRFH